MTPKFARCLYCGDLVILLEWDVLDEHVWAKQVSVDNIVYETCPGSYLTQLEQLNKLR